MHDKYLNAERALIGSVFLNPDILDDVISIVGSESDAFCDNGNAAVWKAITGLYRDRRPIDMATVVNRLGGALEAVGGVAGLDAYTEATATSHNATEYAHSVVSGHAERQITQTSKRLQSLIDAGDANHDALTEYAQSISQIVESGDTGGPAPASSGLCDLLSHIEERRKHGSAITGATSGIGELDRLLRGFRPGTMTAIAARPGVGKTAIALNIALAAATANNPVVFFSMEMGRLELNQRLLSILAGRSFDDLCNSFGQSGKDEVIRKATGTIERLPLHIDDSAGLTQWQLRSRLRRWARKHRGEGTPVVIVDYLQLFRGDPRVNRHEFIGQITRECKVLAGELGIAVIILCQLGRDADGQVDPATCLSKLRESGSIEQDCDSVLIALKDAPDPLVDAARNAGVQAHEFINMAVVKNRQGPVGPVSLHFRKSCQRITELFSEGGTEPTWLDEGHEEEFPENSYVETWDDF